MSVEFPTQLGPNQRLTASAFSSYIDVGVLIAIRSDVSPTYTQIPLDLATAVAFHAYLGEIIRQVKEKKP